ncbi:bacteriocin-like protein [Flavobacterium sp.]|uniref:bacteriocin-like protein n=1 Tax=Flavobacterium sp. TaxID=239 RepID=UPI003D14BAD6
MKNLQNLSNLQKLSKEELKSINGGGIGSTCEPWPLCEGEEKTLIGTNSCGWYIYQTSGKGRCMEYGLS